MNQTKFDSNLKFQSAPVLIWLNNLNKMGYFAAEKSSGSSCLLLAYIKTTLIDHISVW